MARDRAGIEANEPAVGIYDSVPSRLLRASGAVQVSAYAGRACSSSHYRETTDRRRARPTSISMSEDVMNRTNRAGLMDRNGYGRLVQMGSRRAGWYSYDWVDNDSHPSATTIVPALQHIAPGDVMPSLRGAKGSFLVAAVQPERDLILTVPVAAGGLVVSWEFFLEPLTRHRTRLLVPRWLMAPAAMFGHGVIQARQVKGIKSRAEGVRG